MQAINAIAAIAWTLAAVGTWAISLDWIDAPPPAAWSSAFAFTLLAVHALEMMFRRQP